VNVDFAVPNIFCFSRLVLALCGAVGVCKQGSKLVKHLPGIVIYGLLFF